MIRRATASDAPAILECLRIAFEPFRSFYSPQGFDDTCLTPQTIGNRLTEMSVFVWVSEKGEVAGTIACSVVRPGEGHLRGMAVLPEHQGECIAQELLNAAEDHLRGLGCTHISLDTTAPLQRAIRFYQRNGYLASGKIGDHFGLPLFEYVKRLSE